MSETGELAHVISLRPEPDLGIACQQAAEARLEGCWNALYYHEGEVEEDDDGNPLPEPEDPSRAPFCGCTTCTVRETLDAAWDVIDAYIEREVARRTGSPAPETVAAAD